MKKNYKEQKKFSLFDVTFENRSFPRKEVDKIGGEGAYEKMYGLYDKFIDELYLRGLELDDSFFVGDVIDTFVEGHQSGFPLKTEIKNKSQDVQDFFEQHGQWFLEHLGIGAETEQYKSWRCKLRVEE